MAQAGNTTGELTDSVVAIEKVDEEIAVQVDLDPQDQLPEDQPIVMTDPLTCRVIYIITSVDGNEENDPLRSRAWGYYFNLEDAKNYVELAYRTISDMGYYRYIVISALPEGANAISTELEWYQVLWIYAHPPHARTELIQIEKPEKYSKFNFGIL